jgi:cold shock CspA family protein
LRLGKVVTWRPGTGKGTGYGFIRPASGPPEVFVHVSVCERCGVAQLSLSPPPDLIDDTRNRPTVDRKIVNETVN